VGSQEFPDDSAGGIVWQVGYQLVALAGAEERLYVQLPSVAVDDLDVGGGGEAVSQVGRERVVKLDGDQSSDDFRKLRRERATPGAYLQHRVVGADLGRGKYPADNARVNEEVLAQGPLGSRSPWTDRGTDTRAEVPGVGAFGS